MVEAGRFVDGLKAAGAERCRFSRWDAVALTIFCTIFED